MRFICSECGKGFEAEDHFGQFFAEKPEEPAKGMCEDCTRRMLEEVDRQGIGKDELDAEVEKETTDCIL